jgi:uncharacterized membrane protein
MTRTFTQRLALLTASLATLLVALALASPSASASNFCGGQIVNSSQTCYGAARTFQIVQGSGDSTGVCVGYNEIARGACTSAATVIVQWNLGGYAFRVPRIIGWSAANTVAHGDAF